MIRSTRWQPEKKDDEAEIRGPHPSFLDSPVDFMLNSRTTRTQRTVPPEAEKGVGSGTLPSIYETKPLNATYPLRYNQTGMGEAKAKTTNFKTVTPNATTTEPYDMTQYRPKLMQRVAAHLAKVASDRPSNVFPLVINDPETNEPRVLPEGEKHFSPERKILMAPALGIAAGVNVIGGHSQCFVMSRKEANWRMQQERESNRLIFSWWEARNACRRNEEEIAVMEGELRDPLWSFFRNSITEEEAQCLMELKKMKAPTSGQLLLKPTGAKPKSGVDLNGGGSSSLDFVFASSDRGILMSFELYEKLFFRVLSRVHRHFLTLLRCRATGSAEVPEIFMDSHSQGQNYVQFLLQSQLEMMEAGKLLSGDSDPKGICLPVVSIPEERCFRPMLEAETSFAVTLLWRILEQVRSMLPGMALALQLYTRYVLPHVYENFAFYEQQLPRAGAIGEQAEQLLALPLNLVRQRAMTVATKQAKDDVHYMEGFLKSWAWRTWRRSMVGQRQREHAMKLLEARFKRLYNAIRLQKCFDGWRLAAKEGRFVAQLDVIDVSYKSFLSGARNAAREVQLFPELGEGLTSGGSTTLDKNKFVAMKLAETAQHTKAKKKSVPLMGAESAPKQVETQRAENKESGTSSHSFFAPGTKRRSVLIKMALEEPSAPPPPTESKEVISDEVSEADEVAPTKSTFITSVPRGVSEGRESSPLQNRAITTFDGMLQKLQEMETISGYLRQEIAIQNKLIQKLERENSSLKNKTHDLEESLFNSEEQRLEYSNLLQEKELDIRELTRRITQLKSRLRCQRHRPWQRTVMRVIGEICGASTSVSECADDIHVARKMVAPAAHKSSTTIDSSKHVETLATGSSELRSSRNTAPSRVPEEDSMGENDERSSISSMGPSATAESVTDEERLFGKIAPLVIVSTRDMPDAQTILRDWANGCLEDLESLDDLKGGTLSTRFSQFSDEVRNGVLFSRLLFYLALPRYQNKTAVAQAGTDETKNKASSHLSFTLHRQQLLMQKNVQLETPFPTYSECFGDLLNLKPSGRMSLLLQFATELMEGQEQLGDEYIKKQMARIREAAVKATELVPLPSVDRVEMLEIVDPYALSRGDRSATITFIALLYVRFSHPFNHKARQSALIEREAILYLLSGGTYSLEDQKSIAEGSTETESKEKKSTEEVEFSIARRFLTQLEEEDHTPWQLFLNHCKPLINTMAHPFVLRGNFWPSVAFNSPELAQMLGSLGIALNRSLEVHRWHIIVSCLVPVKTFSGLSRGTFTGSRASPFALQAGLEREGEWFFAMEMPCVQEMFEQRGAVVREAIQTGTLVKSGTGDGFEWKDESEFIAMDKKRLLSAFGTCVNDLLQLFLQSGSFSGSCAMPALDLGSWRLIWIDLGLVNPDDTEKSILDLEQITRIFCSVTSLVVESRKEVRNSDPSVDALGSQRLPTFAGVMYFSEFLVAVVLLAHEMFPPLGDKIKLNEGGVVWLADALSHLVFRYIGPILITNATEDPARIIRSFRANVKTEQVLIRYNKALLLLFNTYCKDVCGVSGMERESLLQMLRDAMLTSTDISQNLIYELFMPFSVTRKVEEGSKEERRREQDARPRDLTVQRRRGNVNILDPNSEVQFQKGKSREVSVLLYDGFIEFLCVLCHFKQPNPLIPFDQRLEIFLRRGLLRPLAQRNDALSAIMSLERRSLKPEG
ncbi:hypothetical protein MOQ_000546 [Trypanosoma cruzi marinkellei]|uniref:Uncharacterized protein n=1 Tax=Trypanosoma cruzi marinkellei TaxID=85056 RepID=K2NN69_TRYCR|nr:hypothetical protein MOQ_000546 [Trypanosoma cruzi marinkellei]